MHHALGALAEMGPAGAELAAMLPPRFDSDDDWISVRSAIAHWHLVGDADAVVPTLVRHVVCLARGHEAVRCLADVGRAAAAAIPRLREAVSSEQPAEALKRIGPS